MPHMLGISFCPLSPPLIRHRSRRVSVSMLSTRPHCQLCPPSNRCVCHSGGHVSRSPTSRLDPPYPTIRTRRTSAPLCATDKNIVKGNVDELDDITNGTHDYYAPLACGHSRSVRDWGNLLKKPRPTACEILMNSRRSARSNAC